MPRILIVDDEQEWRDLLHELLGDAGYTVDVCENGVFAFDQIKKQRPDVIVIDIRMSPSGRDVLRSLKRLMPELPVVIYSSYSGFKGHPAFALADAFVEKSADTSKLVDVVSELVAGKTKTKDQ